MPEWVDILFRSVLTFFLVIILVRLMGKKGPVGAMPFRFVNYVTIGVISALIVLKVAVNLAFGLLALVVWTLLPIGLDYLSARSKTIHDLLHGRETILVKQGKIMEENLMKVRLTGEDLLQALRTKNVFNLADVEFAVLETTGEVNVFLKADRQPMTAHDLEWKTAPQSEPQTVILDGNILNEALKEMGLNRGWLHTQLEGAGVTLDNVFVGQVDANGELYLDLFDDAVKLAAASVRELLYAGLEKAKADLEVYALETKTEQAKKMYAGNAEALGRLLVRLRPYLLR